MGGEDFAPRTGRRIGDEFAQGGILLRSPLGSEGSHFDRAAEAGFANQVQDLFDLAGGVLEPARLAALQQELLFFELEHQQFQEFPFAPEQR